MLVRIVHRRAGVFCQLLMRTLVRRGFNLFFCSPYHFGSQVHLKIGREEVPSYLGSLGCGRGFFFFVRKLFPVLVFPHNQPLV